MDGVTAKIAEEVGMLFNYADLASGPREKQSRHHPGWAASDHDQIQV
jgi:hypothetical protein